MIVCGTIGKILDMDWASIFYQSGEVRMDASPYFADDEIDRLLYEGRTTLDEDARNEIYQQFRERALELSPLVFICYREQAFVSGNYVENFDFLSGVLSQQAGICLEPGRSERALTVHFSKSDATDAIGIPWHL